MFTEMLTKNRASIYGSEGEEEDKVLFAYTKENNSLRVWPISKKVYDIIILTFGEITC